jgi:hypothetical protein
MICFFQGCSFGCNCAAAFSEELSGVLARVLSGPSANDC